MTPEELKTSARELLENNILQFWLNKMQDNENGGFYGRMDGYGNLHPHADKGCVLNARLLWTFAAAYRLLGKDVYLQAALRAKEYLMHHFIDQQQGGVFWSVDYMGRPKDTKKQTYALAFTIYAMSELVRATANEEALGCAIDLFESLEQHAFDPQREGYIEALTANWSPIADMRLSDKDENGSRTMNTHLHVLEAYTNLYRVWKKPKLEQQLRLLIGIFTHRLLNPHTHHLDLFFDDNWQGRRNIESFGHDIEAAWLITEALEVLADEHLKAQVMPVVSQIAKASEEGLTIDGSMIHERTASTTDDERHWWVQCECVIGELNQYEHFNDKQALQKAINCYQYILNNLVDYKNGEWYWSRRADGSINRCEDHAGFWKCPYHNSRMCIEMIERLNS